MNGREFLRKASRYARRHRLEFGFNPAKGKGSHGEVHIGGFKTTVQHGEIKPDTLHGMLRDLRIDRREFYR